MAALIGPGKTLRQLSWRRTLGGGAQHAQVRHGEAAALVAQRQQPAAAQRLHPRHQLQGTSTSRLQYSDGNLSDVDRERFPCQSANLSL